jgi:GNAT superfamily N-acetyltransferase
MTTLTTETGPAARGLLDIVQPIYTEVYAEPPYHEGPDDVADFARSWERRITTPGFRLVIAHDDDEAIGFSFGHELPVTTDWWDGTLSPLPNEFTQERPGRTFAIIELAVRKPHRRRGIAYQMHEQLLAEVATERVTLLVRPEPETAPARAAYMSWGYHKIGQIRPSVVLPIYDAMLLDRRRG